jgi:hypothetical protein
MARALDLFLSYNRRDVFVVEWRPDNIHAR